MINTALFLRLRELGKVVVSGENSPAKYNLPDKVSCGLRRTKVNYAQVRSGGWGEVYYVNCPVCGDKHNRLAISHVNGFFVRPKNSKTPVYFYPTLVCYNEGCDARGFLKDVLASIPPDSIGELSSATLTTKVVQRDIECTLPCNLPLEHEGVPSSVLDYLQKERRFDLSMLSDSFDVRYLPAGSIIRRAQPATETSEAVDAVFSKENRILIPIYYGGRMVSWQARAVDKGYTGKAKYLFPSNSESTRTKSQCLYNMDKAKWFSEVVLCEGVTDVWRVGLQGVATFGSSPSEFQVEILRTLWGFDGQCIYLIHPDAQEKAMAFVQRAVQEKIFPRGIVPILMQDEDGNKRDAADMDNDEIQELIAYARTQKQ